MELRLSTCTVRSWRRGDAGSLARHANNRKVWINLRERFPHPYTLADAERFIAEARKKDPETSFAIALDGQVIGGIGFSPGTDVHSRLAEVGFWLGEEFWGRGIATEALKAITEHAFSEHDLCRLHAMVFEWNPASMRVLEKAGYILEGRLRKSVTKDGKTIDQVIYARVKD